ncbi:MAG: DUF4236 domain-containing protein [Chitinophagales bacterium]|nr:DUF4236 domain-containing protein [Chitinophagales bacterium]MDW8393234.1 DUF4236 domain-containing protein [Chitinophagales bacterium]
MPFYIRKSIQLGPLRFNFSKSGMGVSFGVRGLRIGTGPRGHYVHMGAGGVYYRQSLGRKRKKRAKAADPHQIQRDFAQTATPPVASVLPEKELERVYETAASGLLVDSDAQQLLDYINHRRRRMAWFPVMGLIGLLLVVFSAVAGKSLVHAGVTAVLAFLLGVVAWQYDLMRRFTVVYYDLDEQRTNGFRQVVSAFEALRQMKRIWNVLKVRERKEGTYTVKTIQQGQVVKLRTGQPPFLRLNLNVPLLPAGKQQLALLPDRLLITDRKASGTVSYNDIRITCRDAIYAFTPDQAPSDAARIPEGTWTASLGQNVFCVCGELLFESAGGLNELFVFSDRMRMRQFAETMKVFLEPEYARQIPPVDA